MAIYLKPKKPIKKDGLFLLRGSYDLNGVEKELFISVDEKYSSDIDSSLTPFFVVALLIAMENGENLIVEGSVSEVLYDNVHNSLMDILCINNDNLEKVEVSVKGFSRVISRSNGVATGFSCGIDSFDALNTHYIESRSPSYSLNRLTQINHSQGNDRSTLWQKSMSRYRGAAAEINLPLIEIGTNFYSHLKSAYSQVHTLLNCSAVMGVKGLVSEYFYASGYGYNEIEISPSLSLAHLDPIILPLISTESTSFRFTGSSRSRFEKTLIVSKIPLAFSNLEVCAKSPSGKLNCSKCYKCKRTILALDIMGVLNSFSSVFDLGYWKRRGQAYRDEVLSAPRDVFMQELKLTGSKTGYFARKERIRRSKLINQKSNADTVS